MDWPQGLIWIHLQPPRKIPGNGGFHAGTGDGLVCPGGAGPRASLSKVLNNFYVPARDPNGHPEGPPFEHYGRLQSEQAIDYAGQILVTGASTGIGSHLTRRLAVLGHRVLATARKPADLERLAAIPGVEPVSMTAPEGH
jgi:hypothetical protein